MRNYEVVNGKIDEELLSKASSIDAALSDLIPDETQRLATLALMVTRFMKQKGCYKFELQLFKGMRLDVHLRQEEGVCMCGDPKCENSVNDYKDEVMH